MHKSILIRPMSNDECLMTKRRARGPWRVLRVAESVFECGLAVGHRGSCESGVAAAALPPHSKTALCGTDSFQFGRWVGFNRLYSALFAFIRLFMGGTRPGRGKDALYQVGKKVRFGFDLHGLWLSRGAPPKRGKRVF